MRAVVVGAGLAGSIASLVLARRGWQVAVLDKLPRPPTGSPPGRVHAHVFRSEDLAWVGQLVRPLAAAGNTSTKPHRRERPRSDSSAFAISRRGLDLALAGALGRCRSISTRYGSRPDSVRRHRSEWRVRLDTGERYSADLVLDASGRALGAARLVAAAGGRSIEVEEISDTYRYRTWIATRPTSSSGTRPTTVFLDGASLIHLLPEGQTRSTLTWIGQTAPPEDWSSLCGGVEAVDSALARALGHCTVISGPTPYNAGALARSDARRLPSRLLLLGDSLIQTPPRYGDGLRHVCVQARLLEEHLDDARCDFIACRRKLAAYAERVWDGVALALGLETGAVF